MNEGQIKTTFTGDASALVREMRTVRNEQADIEKGWERWGKAGKQAGVDLDQMMGMVDKDAIALKARLEDCFLGAANSAKAAASTIKGSYLDVSAALGDVDMEARKAGEAAKVLEAKYRDGFLGIETGAKRAAMAIKSGFHDISTALGGKAPYDWGSAMDFAEGKFARETKTNNLDSRHRGMMEHDIVGMISAQGGLPKDVLDDIDKAQNKIREGLKGTNNELKRSGGLTSNWAREAASVAASYIGVQEAINLAMQARQKQIELEDRAKGSQITAAQAHERMFANVGSDKGAFNQLLASSNAISAEFGIGDQDAMARLMETTTSKMAGDPTKGAEVARVTAQAKRFSLGTDGSQYAIGVSNLMQAIPGLKAEQASSMLLSLGTESSIVQQAMLSQYITPTALAGMATSDLDKVSRIDVAKEGLAGAATLAKFAGDEEGRTSSTNWNLFSYETQKYFKENGLQDPGSAMRRVDSMTPEQLTEFEGKLGGDARLKPFVTLLAIRKNKEMRDYFDNTKNAINPDARRHREHSDSLTGLSPATRVAADANKVAASKSLADIYNERQGTLSAAREAFDAAQDELQLRRPEQSSESGSVSWMGRKAMDAASYWSATGDAKEVRAKLQLIKNQRQIANAGAAGYRNVESNNLDNLENLLANLAQKMEALDKTLEKNNQATEENTAAAAGVDGYVDPSKTKLDQAKRKNRP